mgnify:CR=1 FL=1
MNDLADSLKVAFAPAHGWDSAAVHPAKIWSVLVFQTIPLALIPAVAWYFGATRSGWTFSGETTYLTSSSALVLTGLFYIAMVGAVLVLSALTHWMASTYDSGSSFGEAVKLISFTATPFFLAGVLGFYPLLWLDLTVGVAVACYCIFLLYRGTSVVLGVAPERAFLYASAIFAAALVGFVALLSGTIILWDLGPAPEFVSG